jgi:TonB family protein
MAMPGGFLPKRSRRIIEGGPAPPISRTRMACVVVICTITCGAFASGRLDGAPQHVPEQSTKAEHPSTLQILTPHEGVDFTAFSNHLLRAIQRNWWAKMPEQAKQGEKGKVAVRFRILKSGKLDGVPRVEVSSGNKALDSAAVAAIRASTPFESLAESFKGPNIELRLVFFYNQPISALKNP